MSTSVYRIVTCRNCGAEVPLGTFCNNCGERLTTRTAFREEAECAHCGQTVAKGIYCTYCGKKLPPIAHEKDHVKHLAELIKRNYFPFTDAEKEFTLYMLSNAQDAGDEIICAAPLHQVSMLFEIYDSNMEQLKKCLDQFCKHATVEYRLPTLRGGFNWTTSLHLSKKGVELGINPAQLAHLTEYVEKEKTLGIWT